MRSLILINRARVCAAPGGAGSSRPALLLSSRHTPVAHQHTPTQANARPRAPHIMSKGERRLTKLSVGGGPTHPTRRTKTISRRQRSGRPAGGWRSPPAARRRLKEMKN
ncbi:unnamed protein product [Arctia plantaginis]|uniref:Uncharacterized protein n=1 Tax=Arctia plantaginis TaxID=874455 RepID=A0A8S1AU73_ARCPL|nr:unnamed protein product [Arctia plantaginis]